jgi:hypothetical protein
VCPNGHGIEPPAIAAARKAILVGFEEASADVNVGLALVEALDVAVAISHNRA